MRHSRPIPADLQLEPTLARRVQQLRVFRNFSVSELAQVVRFSVRRIEDIESGLETWLSAPDRQCLAKALGVEPQGLQEVEVRRYSMEEGLDPKVLANLSEAILHGERSLSCPRCGDVLICSVQEALDLENNPCYFPKAFCRVCPFVLK